MAIGTGAAIIGGSLLSGVLGSRASRSAARAQEQANAQAIAEQRRQYDVTRADFAPWREVGAGALNNLAQLYGVQTQQPAQQQQQWSFDPETGQFSVTGGQSAQQTQPAQRDLSGFFSSPGYQFKRDEGMRGLEQWAAARGGAFSGNALRGLANFNSGLASQEYGAYTDRLAQLAGLGQGAAASGAAAGTTISNNISGLAQSSGDARASGIIGGANSLAGGIDSALNNWLLYRGGAFGGSGRSSTPSGGYRRGGY
jgi:hypothetical protein